MKFVDIGVDVECWDCLIAGSNMVLVGTLVAGDDGYYEFHSEPDSPLTCSMLYGVADEAKRLNLEVTGQSSDY